MLGSSNVFLEVRGSAVTHGCHDGLVVGVVTALDDNGCGCLMLLSPSPPFPTPSSACSLVTTPLLQFVAEEVRVLLAELGFRSLEEVIGRADVLSTRSDVPVAKTGKGLDLDFITNLPDVSQDRLVGSGFYASAGRKERGLRSGGTFFFFFS